MGVLHYVVELIPTTLQSIVASLETSYPPLHSKQYDDPNVEVRSP